MTADGNPSIGKTIVKEWVMSADERARYLMELREKERRDISSLTRKARLEGQQEGRLEEKLATAKKLMLFGYEIDKIIKITGLSREEVEGLLKES